jgi:hypothetical protein
VGGGTVSQDDPSTLLDPKPIKGMSSWGLSHWPCTVVILGKLSSHSEPLFKSFPRLVSSARPLS